MTFPELSSRDALLIVDVQNDFFHGGALPVGPRESVIQVLNAWIEKISQAGGTVVASRDFHPDDHVSFEFRGGPWPVHCVRGTLGAEFCEELKLPPTAMIVSKGVAVDVEQYSPLDGNELGTVLRDRGIERLWVGGVALDVCVRAAVLDALKVGFETHLLLDATAAVTEQGGRDTIAELEAAGARLVLANGE